MGKNIVQKIIDSHIISGVPEAGHEIGIRIDQTLTQDATGTMAYLQFESLGFDRVSTEVSVSYIDHNTIQDGFENADDHKYLETIASKYGIYFSRAGNGICHQVHLERFGVPGKTLLGSDSHTPTGGGIGMFAIGAGGLDVAVAMGGGPFYLIYPKVIKVELEGSLRPWTSAKDVILKILSILTTKGNVGYVLEYGGEGVKTLTVPERATIANMGAELGVTTSVFPSDEMTLAFLKAQNRSESFIPLSADADAPYDRVIKIDLSSIEPMVACPHSPDNVIPVREAGSPDVDQVLIGSCTNSSYRDIMMVASLLKGRTVPPSVSLGVACGSRQVFEMISSNGALSDIIAAGARILELACGFCIGNSQAPRTDAVSVRTSNRNFYGRSGTPSAGVYLVSPETAVAAALSGKLVDPRDFFRNSVYPSISMPEKFIINDNMIIPPQQSAQNVTIYRGPNIGSPPSNEAFPENLNGIVSIKVGDKITTDHIMPAGSRLKYRSNIPKYAQFVFEREDPEFAKRAAVNRDAGLHNIIVAGYSYGQGSSREHAAICPMFLGVKMIIAKSIERIHRTNLINFGILPSLFENPDDYDFLSQNDKVTARGIITSIAEKKTVVLEVNGKNIPLTIELSDREREILLAGGLLNLIRGR